MSEIAIRVQNLSKRYRIGALKNRHDTLRDQVVHRVKSWFSRNGQGSTLNSQPSTLNQLPTLNPQPVANPQPSDILWALKDVSFEIKHGEVVGFIGRNGAGKSTLLKILSRITEPTSGRVEIHGRVGSLLEVGTGFHAELTGRENIYLNGAILGMKKWEIENKFDEIVAFSEIEKFIDTPVKRYSSGMYVRLAFAVAAHLEPEILIVDEVLSVGDTAFQKKCLGKIENVAQGGRTVLFVSHNLASMRHLCGSGVLIEQGRIVKKDKIGKVIEEYVGKESSSRCRVKIRPEDHVTGLHGIRVWEVRLLNGEGELFAVPWKTAIHLNITIEVSEPFKTVNFGVGVSASEGSPVFTLHSLDAHAEPYSFVPGVYDVRVEIDNPLRIGIYNLIIGAHGTNVNSTIFYVPDAIRLEIIGSEEIGESYVKYNSGVVNGHGTWSIVKRPDSLAVNAS